MLNLGDQNFIWYVVIAICILALTWATHRVVYPPLDEPKNKNRRNIPGPSAAGTSESNGSSKRKRHNSGSEAKKQARIKADALKKLKAERFVHPWLTSSLKSHTGTILDMDLSQDDKLVVTCADDRTAYVWVLKELTERDCKNFRVNIPFDHGVLVGWSPDNTAFLLARKEESFIEVYKISRKPDGTIAHVLDTPLKWYQSQPTPPGKIASYVGLGVASTGKYIMAALSSGCIEIRDVKGYMLKRFYCSVKDPFKVVITPCGRYVGIAGQFVLELFEIVADVPNRTAQKFLKWNVQPTVDGPITDISFNQDSSKLAVVTDEGTWIVYSTAGDKLTEVMKGFVEVEIEDCITVKPLVKLSPDARIVVIGLEHSVYFYSTFSGKLLGKILKIFKGPVTDIEIPSDGKHVILSGDSMLYIFKNVCWLMENVERIEGMLTDTKLTGATIARLSSELSTCKEELSKYQ